MLPLVLTFLSFVRFSTSSMGVHDSDPLPPFNASFTLVEQAVTTAVTNWHNTATSTAPASRPTHISDPFLYSTQEIMSPGYMCKQGVAECEKLQVLFVVPKVPNTNVEGPNRRGSAMCTFKIYLSDISVII